MKAITDRRPILSRRTRTRTEGPSFPTFVLSETRQPKPLPVLPIHIPLVVFRPSPTLASASGWDHRLHLRVRLSRGNTSYEAQRGAILFSASGGLHSDALQVLSPCALQTTLESLARLSRRNCLWASVFDEVHPLKSVMRLHNTDRSDYPVEEDYVSRAVSEITGASVSSLFVKDKPPYPNRCSEAQFKRSLAMESAEMQFGQFDQTGWLVDADTS